jgi:hypothetical protein
MTRSHARADPETVPVEIHAPDELPDARRAEIRESLAALVLGHRFLYFIDVADRHDGDYGLVEPPPAIPPDPA